MDREELNKISENHRLWVNDEGRKCADLNGLNLECENLFSADLQGADLDNTDLNHADLSNANLQDADLRNADLSNADLNHADLICASLKGANLTGADIDFSCWPLWCGSLGVIVDARIARQLMYHALSVICDDPEFLEIRNDPKMLKFVNKFHRVEMGDCPELEPIEGEK